MRHGAILEAVAFAAERLLLTPDWRDAADEVLARIGAAADVSRAYIIENHFDDEEELLGSVRFEWCAPGIESQKDNTFLNDAPWRDLPRWAAWHAAGEPVVSAVADLPAEERPEFEAQGTLSIAEHPVFTGDWWWGAIGFDDCEEARIWGPAEEQALRATATLLGAAITRQRVDEQRRRAEDRWGHVVELIPAVTYSDELDSDNGVRMGFVSPQIEQILGFPPERFLEDARFWFSLMHPDDRARLEAAGAFSAEDTEPFDEEYRMRAADGTYRWVHDGSQAIYRDDGSVDYFLGFMTDITASRAAQHQLRVADERFRTIVEQTPAVTYQEYLNGGVYDGDQVETFVSPHIKGLLGYTQEEWRRPGFWRQATHPDDLPLIDAESDRVIAAGERTYRQDYRMVAKDGQIVWFRDESVLIDDADGEPLLWQGVMIDITDRKHAEQQLAQAEERFRLLVERSPAIVYMELPSEGLEAGSVAYVSPQISTLLGVRQEAWQEPGAWAAMMHPDDRERVVKDGTATRVAGEPWVAEYRMIAADGRVVWFHDESVLVLDERGAPSMWQGIMVDITDQKAAEQRVREAEERHRALVEHIPAIVYAEGLDANPEDLYVSPQVERILGYTPDQWRWTADFWKQHVHPDDLAGVVEINDRVNESGATFLAEYRFRAADGSYRWLRDEAVRVHDDDGRPLFWQGVMLDITDQKRAQQDLREADERYRAVVEHIPAVVYTEAPDADPAKFYISPQVTDLFGYTADEWTWTADFWRDRIHPDDAETVVAADERSNETLEAYTLDYRFRHRDGHWVWVRDEATFVPELDGEGFWQGFMLDITERKHAEDQLREAELKFRTIVEQNQAIFYTQDIDPDDPAVSRTTYIAPGNTEMLGYTLEDIQDDPTLWRAIVHPDDRDRVFEADAESNLGEGDSAFSMEYRMISKDGRIVWVQDEATLVRLPGKPPYWQGFLLDVTERKEAEAQLERALDVERDATQRLRALDEMKNTFLQAVSHDLRTPLAAILGLAITLERGDIQIDDDDAKDLAHRIASNARRLDRMVTNLLDLDRLARGIVAPKLESTDVGALLQRVLDETDLIEDSRLVTDLQPVVQPIDAAKVERIVENLLANTVRHTPSNASIWVRVWPEPDGVTIAVEDSGPGVPVEIRDIVFEPFRQGPEAPQHSPGVGVGLTLVRRFAELHGGRAWVQERDGGGASFRVFLPAAGPTELVPPDDHEASRASAGLSALLPPAGLDEVS